MKLRGLEESKFFPSDKKERMVIMGIADAVFIAAASILAILLRFDMNASAVGTQYWHSVYKLIPITIIITIPVFIYLHLYRVMWSMASVREALQLGFGTIFSTLIQVAASMLIAPIPRTYFFSYFVLFSILTFIERYCYRIYRSLSYHGMPEDGIKTIIVGAGSAGEKILREIQMSEKMSGDVVCMVDDKKSKLGSRLHGVLVAGTSDDLVDLVNQYGVKRIIVAMPSASPEDRKRIIEQAQKAGVKDIKVLPGIYQLVKGEVSISKLRNVDLLDLLGRDPVKVNLEEVASYIHDKVVLVTGGGGSIGSELCRQIAAQQPKKLVVFDIYENNVYDIQQELKITHPELNAEYLIGSVRNQHRVNEIFEEYHPDLVYHAAAHKHVPLMEDSPNEAIKNNVMGTYNVAKAANKYKTKKFVLISTDKAVNPTNIMGASKRICEMIVQMMSRHSETDFVAVRFGNVLGSNGSVIPLFKKQIANGGPVTVTHPDIIRYFMTIPEAVSLVLQAGAYAHGGEIFVLDMGEPVKIADMARNLIKLSGYEPDVDIKITYTGLRPGEKLYEEMLMKEEGMKETPNKMIHIGQPIIFDDDHFKDELQELNDLAYEDTDHIRELVERVVPTYHPAN
ncbi:polysaccharide biosynthesis protein [Sharpea azabuensis]|uniref:polysaccharide biosynthesis protein n=1 Tax=Sharpea azabuensis TaxID=322505 RepID=UPI0023F0ADB0|nr:nucleoside-diphosphate sugar epimerase/dehydratase [Sharpea azabuensis]